ncbi:hypothetical protein, partial [Acetobacter orientalis]|uniref:hypothetical protein n=1 Tax=Acetobacter orientalis TaxID=146474 RepID=UPI0039ED370F
PSSIPTIWEEIQDLTGPKLDNTAQNRHFSLPQSQHFTRQSASTPRRTKSFEGRRANLTPSHNISVRSHQSAPSSICKKTFSKKQKDKCN